MSVPTPESHQKSPLAKSLVGSTLCDSDVHAKQLPFSEECRRGNQGFSDKRNTNGQMADLENSQTVSGLALLRFSDLWHLQ